MESWTPKFTKPRQSSLGFDPPGFEGSQQSPPLPPVSPAPPAPPLSSAPPHRSQKECNLKDTHQQKQLGVLFNLGSMLFISYLVNIDDI